MFDGQVVIRRLPPHLTKEQLEEHLSPLPSFDYFEFFSADPRYQYKSFFSQKYICIIIISIHDLLLCVRSLYPHLFSRAYINFKNQDDILLFRDRFDGYVFIDNKGDRFFHYKNALSLLIKAQGKTVEWIKVQYFSSALEYKFCICSHDDGHKMSCSLCQLTLGKSAGDYSTIYQLPLFTSRIG